jgi:hypothetical protein
MVVMFNGRPTENDRVTMQRLWRVNVMCSYLLSHTHIPNIAVVHKQVEVEMADGSTPPHKFTDLCREFMLLTSSTLAEGKPAYLFDAVIPILSGLRAGSAVVTYRMDNKEAAELINKIKRSVASWFYGYWTQVRKYRPGMVIKLMESFDTDAAKLAGLSKFDPSTLTVHTRYGDVDEQLDGVEAELGIDQGWAADLEEDGTSRIDVVGHREALAQTLCNRVEDIDNADRSGSSCRTDFSCSTGNSTNNSEATVRQHTLRAKALRNIDLVDQNYTLENDL